MSAQTSLNLAPPIARDEHGRVITQMPGIVLLFDRVRDVTPFAGEPGLDPGPGGCGAPPFPAYGSHRRIHVISTFAFGEIRSYELAEGGRLLLAYPCHTGLWPEMDAEVARLAAALTT
ncbi:MAG: hypothetical protein JNK56_07025 [Myxococcales bacterium]|nr:hypothetical protein [Myxococcales bacterium]